MSIMVIYCFMMGVLWLDKSKYLLEKDYEALLKRTSIEFNKSIYLRYCLCLAFVLIGIALNLNELFVIVLGVIGYKIVYWKLQLSYKNQNKQINREFPYYLNHLTILVQQNPIVNALEKSISYAPAFFKEDLTILVEDIHQDYSTIKPYLDFARKYSDIEDLSRIMRLLYHLCNKAEQKEVIMTSLSVMVHEKVNTKTKLELQSKLDYQTMIPYCLFLWLGIYIVALFSFMNIGGAI